MVIATAVFSILLVALSSRGLRRVAPGTSFRWRSPSTPRCCSSSGRSPTVAPRLAAQAVYLQVSGLGPMLGSGFWLIATDLFDPRTARSTSARSPASARSAAWLAR